MMKELPATIKRYFQNHPTPWAVGIYLRCPHLSPANHEVQDQHGWHALSIATKAQLARCRMTAGLWAPRSSPQHSCFRRGDENHLAWLEPARVEKKRAARLSLMRTSWWRADCCVLWCSCDCTAPGSLQAVPTPELREGKSQVLHQGLGRWGLHWCTRVLGGNPDPSFGGLPLSVPLGVMKFWWSF